MKQKNHNTLSVYFYAVDPGAVAVMEPLLEATPAMVSSGYLCEGYALKKLPHDLTIDALLATKPKNRTVVVFGSQHEYSRTVSLMHKAKQQGFKTVFIFDHWGNYQNHFLMDGEFVIPDKILVIDELMLQRLVGLGLPLESIAVVGHPAIETKLNQIQLLTQAEVTHYRQKLNVNANEKLLMLALEPLADFQMQQKVFLGYDEYTVVSLLIESLAHLAVPNIQLRIRLHPRITENKKLENIMIKTDQQISVAFDQSDLLDWQVIAAADIVLGMTSAFLITAMLGGKQCLSIQPNRSAEAKARVIESLEAIVITDPTNLTNKLSYLIQTNLSKTIDKNINFYHAIESVWTEITKLIKNYSK